MATSDILFLGVPSPPGRGFCGTSAGRGRPGNCALWMEILAAIKPSSLDPTYNHNIFLKLSVSFEILQQRDCLHRQMYMHVDAWMHIV